MKVLDHRVQRRRNSGLPAHEKYLHSSTLSRAETTRAVRQVSPLSARISIPRDPNKPSCVNRMRKPAVDSNRVADPRSHNRGTLRSLHPPVTFTRLAERDLPVRFAPIVGRSSPKVDVGGDQTTPIFHERERRPQTYTISDAQHSDVGNPSYLSCRRILCLDVGGDSLM